MERNAELSQRLAMPLIANLVLASPGDIVRLACKSDGTWFYCRVEDHLPDGLLMCSVVEAQCWPSLIIDGIRPGVGYAVRPDRVLSVVRASAQ